MSQSLSNTSFLWISFLVACTDADLMKCTETWVTATVDNLSGLSSLHLQAGHHKTDTPTFSFKAWAELPLFTVTNANHLKWVTRVLGNDTISETASFSCCCLWGWTCWVIFAWHQYSGTVLSVWKITTITNHWRIKPFKHTVWCRKTLQTSLQKSVKLRRKSQIWMRSIVLCQDASRRIRCRHGVKLFVYVLCLMH